ATGLLHPAAGWKNELVKRVVMWGLLARPGDDPLSHPFWGSTLGAARFHGRVRNGIGWVPRAVVTRSGQQPGGLAGRRDQRSEVGDRRSARLGMAASTRPPRGDRPSGGAARPDPGVVKRWAWGAEIRGRRSERRRGGAGAGAGHLLTSDL